jgi:hypothetical protein
LVAPNTLITYFLTLGESTHPNPRHAGNSYIPGSATGIA